jgi:hypothetical protein
MNAFYTTLIVLSAIFLLIGIIFVPLFFRGRKKDRVLKGKKALEKKKKEKNGDGIIAKTKEKWRSNRNTILIGGFSFIALLAAFAILLPKAWAVYWGHQEFFWISLFYLATMIATKWLDIWGIKLFIRIAFTIIIVWYISTEFKPPPSTDDGQRNVQKQKVEERIEFYGNKLVQVGPVLSAEYGIPKDGGTMRIKRIDPSIPLTCLMTLLDDTKQTFSFPGVYEGYGDIEAPDSKRMRIQAPKETTIWVIIKPLKDS